MYSHEEEQDHREAGQGERRMVPQRGEERNLNQRGINKGSIKHSVYSRGSRSSGWLFGRIFSLAFKLISI